MNKSYLNSERNTALSLKPSKAIHLFLMVLFVFLTPLISFGQSQKTFNSSGTFVVPAGVTSITVQAWGAGGAGGGSDDAAFGEARGGSGGGGGAYATATFTVASGASLPVVVGLGGIGISADNGGNGGFSTITGYTGTIYAAGGSGGIRNISGNNTSPVGGAGGTVAASKGSPIAGSSGTSGATGYAVNSGDGGAGANGGGAGAASIDNAYNTANGNVGAAAGGGGSGARTSQSGGARAGGAGGAGRIIITWCYGPTATGVAICAGGSGSLTASGLTETTIVNNAGDAAGAGTGATWTNTNDIITKDGLTTDSSIGNNSLSQKLLATNFGFSIPTTATIKGVEVIIGRKASNPNKINDNIVQLLVAGTGTGDNKAALTTDWPNSVADANYGSSMADWSAGLTPAKVNATNFGVQLVVSNNNNGTTRTASVDYIQISITYTMPGTFDWYKVSSGGTKLGSGTSFNPVGVANSGLANTNTAGTTTYYVESSTNTGCRTQVNFVINAVPSTPTATVIQPDCLNLGSVDFSGLPSSGTLNQTGTATASYAITTATKTVSNLAAGTYQFTMSNGSCSSATVNVVITAAATKTTWNGSVWSNGTPTINQAVEFTGNYSSSGNLNACSCTVTSGTVVFNGSHTFTVKNGVVVNGGTLNFKNNSSLVQINNTANTGNIVYERTTPLLRETDYTYWSSPVAGQALNISPDYTYGTFYSYNYTIDDWAAASLSTNMVAGNGYIIRGQKPNNTAYAITGTFTGVPNNGNQSVDVGAARGKSILLGNPYPSALDAEAFLDKNTGVLDGTLYFWTHKTEIQLASNIAAGKAGSGRYAYTSDDYASYNAVGGVGVGSGAIAISGGTIPSGKIASGQGFFGTINSSIAGSTTIMYTNSMRFGGTNNSQFFKTRMPKGTIEKSRIWLNLSNEEGAFKQTLLGYVTGATNDNENRFDGQSLDGNEFVDFYSVNQDQNLVIQGRALPFDENDEVPLGYRTSIDGTFDINIGQVDGVLTNQDVFIEDKLTNTEFNLKSGSYTFSTTEGTFNDRFVLKYKSSSKTLGTGDFETQVNKVLVSVKNKQIKINSFSEMIDKVVIYDVLGRQIYQKDNVNNNELLLSDLASSNQALIVKTTLKNGTTVTDKVVY